MYTPYYNYVPQKKRGIEELYKTEEKTEIKAEPVVKKTAPPQKKQSGILGGFSSLFNNFKEDDIVLALVFLTVFNEHNEEDTVLLVILALLFFT